MDKTLFNLQVSTFVAITLVCSHFLKANETSNSGSKYIVPVHVYVLLSEDAQELNANITVQELQAVMDNVNVIWGQASIEWNIKKTIPRQASAEKSYLVAADIESKMTFKKRNQAMLQSCNVRKMPKDIINVCVVGHMSTGAGGIAYRFKNRMPIVIWPVNIRSNNLTLNPATLAHEFGHALGLPHNKEEDIFLMRGGGNNMRRIGMIDQIKLTNDEISSTRKTAIKTIRKQRRRL